ncbi:hypothetical protein PENTCL1PPCAC_21699 [Pristionchus entomophagus]|uniref:BTB domain-containing protein n=1 Tax=Pristionchus entomophagus TaxID=358040 RepID=A0AAV5TYG3_9BILA|nr:hypothetical protein PENTCL1PPCAC_21699 [Pristionchus entomophagus]
MMGSVDTEDMEKLREQIRLLNSQNSTLAHENSSLKKRLNSSSTLVSKSIFSITTPTPTSATSPKRPISSDPITMGGVAITMFGDFLLDNKKTLIFHVWFELESETKQNATLLARIGYHSSSHAVGYVKDEPINFEFLQLGGDISVLSTPIPAINIKDAHAYQIDLKVHAKLILDGRDTSISFADEGKMAKVKVEDETISVNISYISAWSEFFRGYFASEMLESKDGVYPIEDCTAYEFRELLDVIYPSCKPISQRNVKSLIKLADRFIIPSLSRKCEVFLTDRTKHNLCDARLLRLTDEYRLSFLQAIVLECTTADQLHKNVIAKDEFKSFSEELKKAIDTRYVESKVPERNV